MADKRGWSKIMEGFGEVGDDIGQWFSDKANAVVETCKKGAEVVNEKVIEPAGQAIDKAGKWIGDKAQQIGDGIDRGIDGAVNVVKGIGERAVKPFIDAGKEIVNDWKEGWGKNDQEKETVSASATSKAQRALPNMPSIAKDPGLGMELA